MARRSIHLAVAAAVVAAWPASACAATAPASAPQLTTAQYTLPATLHWTPAIDVLNTSQAVYRASGPCTTPVAGGEPVASGLDSSLNTFIASPVNDGIFCYYIKVTDLTGTTADSAGATVAFDTATPSATLAIVGQTDGFVAGTVGIAAVSADAVSGVASSVLHVGGVGVCPRGPVIGPSWDTTAYANGTYDVCSVVTDNAGHSTTAAVTITVANVVKTTVAAPRLKPRDKHAPRAPTKLTIVLPHSRRGHALLPVKLHWANPAAPDLDRVIVVLNRKRSPRGPADGRVIYRGQRVSAGFRMRAGDKGYVALFAYDHSGNISRASRKAVSLKALVSLRPLTGSVVRTGPLLTWKARKGSVYYNVQVFRNGKRVLIGWPTHASYRIAAGTLTPGTYVWFVWPALKRKAAGPKFGNLIGRATFVYKQ